MVSWAAGLSQMQANRKRGEIDPIDGDSRTLRWILLLIYPAYRDKRIY